LGFNVPFKVALVFVTPLAALVMTVGMLDEVVKVISDP
jgi:hypothetical protein